MNATAGSAPHRFRFGVFSGGGNPPSRARWVALARKAEDLGYSTLVLPDHLSSGLAPIAAMAVAADATKTLRVGCYVFGNDFRNPVLLAKEAASLDLLSDGRLELGLGTGFWRGDYEESGISLDPPGVRVDRFAEAVQVLKGAFVSAASDEPFSFTGTHYTVRELRLRPKPAQQPRPPLVLGGGGRRMLTLAAREADIVSIGARTTASGGISFAGLSPEAIAEAAEWIRAAAGDRWPALELSSLSNLVEVTDKGRQHAAERHLEFVRRFDKDVTVEQIARSPKVIAGTVDEICDALVDQRTRYGLSYLVINGGAMEGRAIDAFAPVVARLAGT